MLARIGVKFFQIVGVPSESEWSQLQVVNSSSMEEMARGGGLSVLMSVMGDGASQRGNEWLQAVVEGFLRSLEKDRVEWMKETVRWFEGVCGEGDSLLLVIVLPHEGSIKRALYLAGKGEIRAYVSRGGAQRLVWDGAKGSYVVSGWLSDGDVVVAGTNHFIDEVWANLEGEVAEMVEEARGSIGAHEKRGRMAGLVMSLGKAEEEEVEKAGGGEGLDSGKTESVETGKIEEEVKEKPGEDNGEVENEIKEEDEDKKEEKGVMASFSAEITTGRAVKEEVVESEVPAEEQKIDDSFRMVEQIVEEVEDKPTPGVNDKEAAASQAAKDDLADRVMGGGFVGQLAADGERKDKRRKIVFLFGLVFLVIFVVALSLGVVRSKRDGEERAFGEFASPIEYNLGEAIKLKSVNQVRARALVEEAKGKYAQGESYKKGRFALRYGELQGKIETTWKEVSGERGVEGKLFADLGAVREGFAAFRAVWSESWGFVVIDKDKGSVATVDQAGTMKVVAGGEKYKSTRSMTVGKKGGYFLTEDGLYLVDFKTQAEKKLVDKDEEIWSGVKEVELFGSSVYLLDRIDIWKYPGLEDGVGKRQRWFKPGVEPDMSKAVEMEIATDIYVLGEDGRIAKFASGAREAFELRLASDVGKALRMAISEEKKEIYVLEKEKSRVMVYDLSSGEYKKQLMWERLGQANDLVMSDEMGKLFVLIEGRMYEIEFS